MRLRISLVLLLLAMIHPVSACANENPYATHYRGRLADAPATEAPRIYRGQSRAEDAQRLLEDGYDTLGDAAFQAGEVPLAALESQARLVGAELVMVYVTPLAIESAAAKMDRARARMRSPDKMQEDGVAQREMRYDYYASFWIRLPPPLFGVHVTGPGPSDSVSGLHVLAVIGNSPADRAGVRKGDRLIRFDGVALDSPEALVETVRRAAGRTVSVELMRDGAPLRLETELSVLAPGPRK